MSNCNIFSSCLSIKIVFRNVEVKSWTGVIKQNKINLRLKIFEAY